MAAAAPEFPFFRFLANRTFFHGHLFRRWECPEILAFPFTKPKPFGTKTDPKALSGNDAYLFIMICSNDLA
jgi:hypothetical protein